MFTGLRIQLNFSDILVNELMNEKHKLFILRDILNWKKINKIYKSCYKSKKGNKTKETDLVIGLFILKHLFRKSYQVIINELHENFAYMYFCGVSLDKIKELNKEDKKIISHSTLVKIKKRLGVKKFKKIERLFFNNLKKAGMIDGKKLISDTTSVESNIIYPTEINLLRRVIEEATAVIQEVKYKKYIIETEIVRKSKQISKVYYSAKKRTKKLLNSCTSQLLKLSGQVLVKAQKKVKNNKCELKKYVIDRYEKLINTGVKIVKQIEDKYDGKKVNDKIVSYFEDYARALPKGKIGRACEFGMKLRIDMSANNYITNYKSYLGNPADVTMLKDAVNEHYDQFKGEFKEGLMDAGFYDGKLKKEIENDLNIKLVIPHKKNKKLTKHEQKRYNKRAAIESKISEGKRSNGLGKTLYKHQSGSEIWTTMSIFVLNIKQFLRDVVKKPKLLYKFNKVKV